MCPAKAGKSNSDLTIADFWGIERSYPELDDTRGVGLLIVNSEKGGKIINDLDLKLKGTTLAMALASNSSYLRSVSEPQRRKECFRLIQSSNKSLDQIFDKVHQDTLLIRIKRRIKRMIS